MQRILGSENVPPALIGRPSLDTSTKWSAGPLATMICTVVLSESAASDAVMSAVTKAPVSVTENVPSPPTSSESGGKT